MDKSLEWENGPTAFCPSLDFFSITTLDDIESKIIFKVSLSNNNDAISTCTRCGNWVTACPC